MTTLKDGSVVTNKKLEIIKTDDAYKEYVFEGDAKTVFENVHPDDWHLLNEMVESLEEASEVIYCFRMRKKSGTYSWVAVNSVVTEDNCIGILVRDIAHIEGEIRVTELDYLTGLYNKKSITDYAKSWCQENKNATINLCIIDIDNFKQINDNFGHSYGDKVLREVASIILEVLGKDGRAGRIGGDELMMVIENVDEKTDLRFYLKGIRERVEELHRDERGFPLVTVSMGVATFPSQVDNYDNLFDLADRMLYRAKNRGKNRYVIYNPDIHGKIVDGELNVVNYSKAAAVDKTCLVLDSINGLFGDMHEAIPTLLTKIAATYDLDEVYIYYKDLSRCVHGFKRVADSGGAVEKNILKVINSDLDISYVTEVGFDNYFNSNGVFVVDTPQKQLINTLEPIRFFNEHGIRHAFLYKMQNVKTLGYVAMYNTREISRKFPQPDITDLTYLSKMMETAIKIR